MRVCGVIAEYDPFHLGHAWHLNQARKACGADYVVCMISSAFTQRGAPSFFSTFDRAKMALLGGADAVFAMPVSFSPMEADRFARGGVQALAGLGVISDLSFGCEDPGSFSLLEQCAQALEHPSPKLENALAGKLRNGFSHVRAQSEALSEIIGLPPEILQRPNNSLALAYLRQLICLAPAIRPVPIQRVGRRDDRSTDGFLSSSVLRDLLCAGNLQEALAGLPDPCAPFVRDCLDSGSVCPPSALDQALFYRLSGMDRADLARYTTLRDGLPDLIHKLAPGVSSADELIRLAVSRRHTRASVRRYLTQVLLDLPRAALPADVPFVRLLGFRETALPLLSAVKKQSTLPVIAKAADHARLLEQDARAERIRGLGCASAPSLFRQSPIVIRRNEL